MLCLCCLWRGTISKHMVIIVSKLSDRRLGNPHVRAGASFAENFYGLKRRRKPLIETERANAAVGGVPQEEQLGPKELRRSLLFLVNHYGLLTFRMELMPFRLAFLTCVRKPKISTKNWVAVSIRT